MRFCRETHKYSLKKVAGFLGINEIEYTHIETGKTFLTKKQARELGKLFKVKSDYFFKAALQLDLIVAKTEIIKIQREKIEELKQQLYQLQSHQAARNTKKK